MKWWGWGHPDVSFPMHERPKLWPWIEKNLGAKHEAKDPIIDLNQIILNKPILNAEFMTELARVLPADSILSSHEERVAHSYGKSYPDLLRIRKGIILRSPDVVIYPKSHEEVLNIVQLAVKHHVKLIPFGGGTNIVGALEVKDQTNMNVSVDMRKMNRVLKIDKVSQRATIEAGILGPQLEEELNKQGYGLGHFPDSFEFSTLGGWIATRSAGMQSDEYGKIENMVSGLKIVSTAGESLFKSFPSTSAGPDLKQLFIGSEGAFGIITEATMKIHALPEEKIAIGFLFPTFKDGLASIIECYKKRITASMIRLQDESETDLALNIKPMQSKLNDMIEAPIKAYLKRSGYHRPAVMVIGLEGSKEEVKFKRAQLEKIFKAHKGFALGRKVEKSWARDKYNMPYLRDYIMDYTCLADVAETSASWGNLEKLYDTTVEKMTKLFADNKTKGYIGCHLSHSYEDGACLYFTYAVKQTKGKELEQYYAYKKFITNCFVTTGGTLSHHHAVGYEHLPWLKHELGEFNSELLKKVKNQLDPANIFSPGSLDTERVHPFMETYKAPH
jgi:alkyldihydroxyacetonephosphate synthase